MKPLLYAATVVIILGAIYALCRPWLKAQPWAAGFFAAIEPWEITLFKKSETILFARLKIVGGLFLTFLAQMGTMDLTPLFNLLPERHRALAQFGVNLLPMLITFIGMADERLRNTTTKPLELVAIPETAPLPAEVQVAVDVAEQAKHEAIAAVKEAGSV